MKKLIATAIAAVLASELCLTARAADGLNASLVDKGGVTVGTTADISALVEEVRDLSLKYAALTSAVSFIEKKCETDAAWRRAYHQGEAAQTVATNEYGIAYRVTIYKDGYVYADCPMVVSRPASPEDAARAEAERKALIASKVEEARQAMERAALPAKVADILAARRAAAQTKEVTVVVEPDK